MEFRYVPLSALGTYADGIDWHDPRVQAWVEVYRALGIVRPLVVNLVNGHILNSPGELEALRKLQTDGETQPQGLSADWRVPVWLVELAPQDERRWTLVLAGGVDHALITRPYDNSIITVLLDEAEQEMNRVKVFGIDLKEYRALLETLAERDELPLNSSISGTPTADYWGIPSLDPGLQAEQLYPAVKWGAAARSKDLSGSLIHFYTDDSKFSALVKDSTPVIAAQAAAAIEVNFSTAPGMSRALMLYRTFQKRMISRRWQQAGIRLLVDLNVDEEFGEINLFGVPQGWRAYAVRAYAKDLQHIETAYGWAVKQRGNEDLLFVVYGGGKRASELCRQCGWAWLNEDSDRLRGRYGAGSAQA
ncbi:MAG: DUF4417 domain-containing protein [Chloroflexi bacterium]|nr:DUF4417 domain-containing protein [Chloroflexota bacterium]